MEQQLSTTDNTRHQHLSPWMDTEKAATYLGCMPGTLKTWRSRGEGPRYRVINHKLIRYHIDDLNAFVRGETNLLSSKTT